MPTQNELAGLYDEGESYHLPKQAYFNVYLTKLIQLTTSGAWASETRSSGAALFSFGDGARIWNGQSRSYSGQALPVRDGK